MPKRNLLVELTEEFDALAAARKGKKTLRATEVELIKPAQWHCYLHRFAFGFFL
jgi:hypothetical protein